MTIRVSGVWLSFSLVATSAFASHNPRIWKDLYKEVHNGADPAWKGRDDAQAWALAEKELIEPIVVQILRGEHPKIGWRSVLFVARVIPTEAIRDALLEPLTAFVEQQARDDVLGTADDASAVSVAIDVFAAGGDSRIIPLASTLMTAEGQTQLVVEHCVLGLRNLGGPESLATLRAVPLRTRSEYIDHLCTIAENAINARAQGRDLFEDAEEALAKLTAEFLHAIEERDFAAFVALQPYGLRRAADEGHLKRELLEHSSVPDIVRALKDVAGREQFQINRDNYEATLVAGGRYEFSYVLEVDGWKISGPIRVGP